MSHLTDDDLERLLADAFSSRERFADPVRAHEVAARIGTRSPRVRRWSVYVAVTAAVCVIVVASSLLMTGGGTDRGLVGAKKSPTAEATDTTGDSYAANRAAAAAESNRIVELVPLPDDATRVDGRPQGWPTGYGTSLGPSDPSLTRTSWWSVPGSVAAVRRYLLDHHPPGMSREAGVGGGPEGVYSVTYDEKSPRPDAYPGVSLLVQWTQAGGSTLVRADTFTAARSVRTQLTFVTGTVEAVDIVRVVPGEGNQTGGRLPPVHLTRAADRQAIDTLVHTVNDLHASIRPRPVAISCPYPGDPRPSIRLTFHSSTGTVTMRVQTWCFGQVHVRRGGKPLNPTLDPGNLAQVVLSLTSG